MKRWIFLWSLVGTASMPDAQDVREPTTSILVAYDTRTGHTERMARAIVEGIVLVEGAQAVLRAQDDVSDEEIVVAAGILVGSPVHWGICRPIRKCFSIVSRICSSRGRSSAVMQRRTTDRPELS